MDNGVALDGFVDEVWDELASGEGIDRARGGGVPRPPSVSAGLWQHRRWEAIIRRMRQWGVPMGTIGIEQPQVVRRQWPQIVRRRGQLPRLQRWTTATNQPDLQTVDPRTGRRVAVEVDTDSREMLRKMALHQRAHPDVRAAFELIDGRTGRPLETHAWNPLTRSFSFHTGGVKRRDVLDFEW